MSGEEGLLRIVAVVMSVLVIVFLVSDLLTYIDVTKLVNRVIRGGVEASQKLVDMVTDEVTSELQWSTFKDFLIKMLLYLGVGGVLGSLLALLRRL